MDKSKAIDSAVTQIERQHGKGAIMRLGDPGASVAVTAMPLMVSLAREGKSIFLDMKLLDIDNTVAKGVETRDAWDAVARIGEIRSVIVTLGRKLDFQLAYGSPAGMPNWLTSGEMDEKTVDLMARYIQHDPPTPPEFGMEAMKATWKVLVPPAQRPTKKMNNYNISNIFSTTSAIVKHNL